MSSSILDRHNEAQRTLSFNRQLCKELFDANVALADEISVIDSDTATEGEEFTLERQRCGAKQIEVYLKEEQSKSVKTEAMKMTAIVEETHFKLEATRGGCNELDTIFVNSFTNSYNMIDPEAEEKTIQRFDEIFASNEKQISELTFEVDCQRSREENAKSSVQKAQEKIYNMQKEIESLGCRTAVLDAQEKKMIAESEALENTCRELDKHIAGALTARRTAENDSSLKRLREQQSAAKAPKMTKKSSPQKNQLYISDSDDSDLEFEEALKTSSVFEI